MCVLLFDEYFTELVNLYELLAARGKDYLGFQAVKIQLQ